MTMIAASSTPPAMYKVRRFISIHHRSRANIEFSPRRLSAEPTGAARLFTDAP
jgi:hypothetical protein